MLVTEQGIAHYQIEPDTLLVNHNTYEKWLFFICHYWETQQNKMF